jgi:hypothetical protein
LADLDWWDACVDAEISLELADAGLSEWVGADASVRA